MLIHHTARPRADWSDSLHRCKTEKSAVIQVGQEEGGVLSLQVLLEKALNPVSVVSVLQLLEILCLKFDING